MSGIFYGVGVGPGDPELLTLKAINAIKSSDVVIAPRTEKKDESTALSIARPYIQEGTEVLELVFPMNYNAQALSDAWVNNKEIILGLLNSGKKVAFLTLGDPMLYSTYMYVFRLLEASGHEIVNIPGVNSFSAIGNRLGVALAEGGDILSIVPATIDDERLERVLAASDNVVLMKVYKNYTEIVEKLHKHGMVENAVMVSKCGLEGEEIIRDLAAAGNQKVNYLSTILTKRSKVSKHALA
ncbi:precorrin-2 C(20)-methyltransferase [Sporomusa sphaeroides]|uniref:Cobalt-precorrin-2 C(20)-methyltransferase n=1 Tax=Sporomusa sphaeroides DSM 2875 TaxID=1337886 RepID=A0ABM9W540_9FIRM|nr:precorrin-2 C(20)-methyltransferase [Sporomusa sphaeroides]MCM0759119.1 precorrin-2 C(20)-methyltransferase [Sporomusa sphaeroides DSM 2875]OLS56048.1 cobalt-precorrin-2 C(20)-methyltransferase [Sporomusa sphaeroides DSM 2875]CVK20259.1 Cobalt-precorrin-2 C(20)-methyltransferase [Sporomusa sphaeroides DSM 2875]HML33514.1 precorrin-2 C(20)-methyltransferase [Sporomusa sphaeroides]